MQKRFGDWWFQGDVSVSNSRYCWTDGNQKSGVHSPVEVGSWNPTISSVLAPSQVVIAGFPNHQQQYSDQCFCVFLCALAGFKEEPMSVERWIAASSCASAGGRWEETDTGQQNSSIHVNVWNIYCIYLSIHPSIHPWIYRFVSFFFFFFCVFCPSTCLFLYQPILSIFLSSIFWHR